MVSEGCNQTLTALLFNEINYLLIPYEGCEGFPYTHMKISKGRDPRLFIRFGTKTCAYARQTLTTLTSP